jgi:hypothetical protein
MPSVTPSLVTHAFARVRPVGALWRLRGYLKPYRTQMIVMFAAACGAVTAEIVIPLLTKAVVDGAIAHHDKSLLIPLSLAAVGLGASEGLLNMIRRWIQAGAVSTCTPTCNGCRRPSTTTGSRASSCRGPRPTCPRSAGSQASA